MNQKYMVLTGNEGQKTKKHHYTDYAEMIESLWELFYADRSLDVTGIAIAGRALSLEQVKKIIQLVK